MANSVDPDQTAPIGAVCSGFTLFASILNSSVVLGNYLQQTTSADNSFRCIFILGALRVNACPAILTFKAPITTKLVCFCDLLKCLRNISVKQCRSVISE